MTSTPRSNRLHIALFGRRNSGKSTLINALTAQQVAVVSDIAGTTTDPVYQSMEIPGLGPCVFIDTAGFDDEGDLGQLRVGQTLKALDKTDVAILLCIQSEIELEIDWLRHLQDKKIPTLLVLNKIDAREDWAKDVCIIEQKSGVRPLAISAKLGKGIDELLTALKQLAADEVQPFIVSHLVDEGNLVLLVMPQDIQAPKGRLILPQVQTLRELLDCRCSVMCCTTDQLEQTLKKMSRDPDLIITDSQVFHAVYQKKPATSKLTSFSVLFARQKGDIKYFTESTKAFANLTATSRVLIAEACTHAPLTEDIGRVKLPMMLRKKFGAQLQIDMVSGADFPPDLTPYDLVIHCGACMFNRKHVLNRVVQARKQKVPMTNYGVAIAWVNGILDKIVY
ncbi:small GTP-binding protein domain protein [gut metagenome]|uniref:Small GTP-binding protein domain protein n=1 Tax=gut metagenome TaxID=749906 RepID=J9GB14_9ZZZZ